MKSFRPWIDRMFWTGVALLAVGMFMTGCISVDKNYHGHGHHRHHHKHHCRY